MAFDFKWTPLALLQLFSVGCSSNCAPTETGGVLVDVRGVTDCTRLSVTASDASGVIPLDAWPSPESDAGVVCSFRGLASRSGTYAVDVSLDGSVVASQTATLEQLDSCNVSSELLTFNLSQP